MKNTTVTILIPIFNEVKTLDVLINRVLKYSHKVFSIDIIFIESNSSDGSKEFLIEFEKKLNRKNTFDKKFQFIYQENAKGKGNAVREGLANAKGEIILIQDADLEYEIDSYDTLLDLFLDNPKLDLVVGKRAAMRSFGNFGLRSFYMNMGHHFFHTLFRILYQVKIQDPTTMFKIFKKTSIEGLKFESNRFDFDWELICKLCRKKVSYKEIEVPYKSRGFEEGKKVGMFIDPLVWLYKIIKYRIVKI